MTIASQQGASLVEVLVSLLILAFGLLGALKLHSATLQNSQDVLQRSRASQLALSIIESMRLNTSEFTQYQGRYQHGSLAAPAVDCHSELAETPRCTPSQLRFWQLYLWQLQLTGARERLEDSPRLLPEAQGCIGIDGAIVEVVISWRGRQSLFDAGAEGEVGALDERSDCGNASDYRRSVRLVSVLHL